MPTARELLEQADALMRRNRERADDADIPELTVVVAESEFATFDEAVIGEASITGEPPDSVLRVVTIAPELTSAPAAEARLEPMLAPLAELRRDPIVGTEPTLRPEWDDERRAALVEELRMQVLQRVDIFTDTALGQQLAERLRPLVERASAELVATLSVQVGELLRAYVAEAIEREIEKLRHGGA